MTTSEPRDEHGPWPPPELRNTVDFVLVQARHRIYLVDDETGESGWRVEWGRSPERLGPSVTPILATLLRRGALTVGHRRTVGGLDADPVYAYELEITPAGRVLHDRVTYGHGRE